MLVQLGLCQTCSKTTLFVFPRGGSKRASDGALKVVPLFIRFEPPRGKQTMWFPNRSDTNRPVQAQKQARSLKFWICKVEELYYPCCENKGNDQLRSYCEADLRLCFRLCRLLVFLCGGSFIRFITPAGAI